MTERAFPASLVAADAPPRAKATGYPPKMAKMVEGRFCARRSVSSNQRCRKGPISH